MIIEFLTDIDNHLIGSMLACTEAVGNAYVNRHVAKVVEGEIIALGSTTDDKNGSTDTTPATEIGILKYLSYLWQSVWSNANTARTTGTKVITVQQVDPNGVTPSYNTNGTQNVMVNAHSYLPATHWSPTDFSVVYTTASTLTASGFTVGGTSITLGSNVSIRSLGVTNASNVMTLYENGVGGISISAAANVITVLKNGIALAVFLGTDLSYKIGLCYQQKGFDIPTDSIKASAFSVLTSGVDATNTGAGTVYYPGSTGLSMNGFVDMSISGKLIDASSATITVEITQDEDLAGADWVQAYGYDVKNNVMVTSFVTTNGTFAWDFDNMNCNAFRIKVVYGSSTNTGIVKIRRKSI